MKRLYHAIANLRCFVFGDEGSTLAEMAIMVPFLAIMLAGVSEFGRYFQAYTTLAKSTRSSARYLSNHPFNDAEKAKARNLAVCGKLACAGGDELLPGLTTGNVCIESVGAPVPTTVTVRIPETADGCADPYIYQPIFDLGALLNAPAFSLAVPIRPGTTMYFMLDN
jgi:Flp pilus assembly protein TadG